MTNLLYASSISGIPLLINSLTSFCKHIEGDITAFVLCSNWEQRNIDYVESKLNGKCKIVLLKIDKSVFDGYNNTKGLPLETLFRLYGLELLPSDVKRVLYLDIDTICISDDVNHLVQFAKEGNYTIAAVPDAGIPDKYCDSLFKESVKEYFNAGVICFNVEYCRSIRLWDTARGYLEDNNFVAVDQDILNIIFNPNYCPLSHRFNYMSPQIFKDMMFVREKNMQSMNPVIIHFDGPQKPWNKICANPYKRYYKQVSLETKLGGSIPSKSRGIKYDLRVLFNYLKYKVASV